MAKKIFLNCLWVIAIWYLIIMAVNCKIQYSWKLFKYDLFSCFCDNRAYLTEIFLPATVLTVVVSFIFVLFLDSNLVMYWNIKIGKYHFHVGDISYIKKYKTILITLTVIGAVSMFAIVSYRQTTVAAKKAWEKSRTIAHAGGSIDGYDYTNCLEAVLANYEKGQRVFEIDFSITNDNKLVCKHGWNDVLQEGGISGEAMDEQTFMSKPILNQYTPLSWEALCHLMNEYSDIWVVTDTKHTDVEGVRQDFEILVRTVKELGIESVLDRIIVQIYNEEMYDTVRQIYPFQSYIFTLYKFWKGDTETFLNCVRFCYEHDISGITTWNYYVTSELMQITKAYGIPWYAHTENNVENAKIMLNLGLSGIYTDTITPNMLIER